MIELLGIDLFCKAAERGVAASFLILAVLLSRPFLRKAPRWISCLLWGMVAVRLVMPMDVESNWSLVPKWTGEASVIVGETAYEAGRRGQEASGAEGYEKLPVVNDEIVKESGMREATVGNAAIESGTQEVTAKDAAEINVSKDGLKGPELWQILKIAWIPWTCGVFAMLSYAFAAFFRMKRKVSDAREVTKGIYEAKEITVPFILGILRPKVYLPEGLSVEERDYVLCHERAHLSRGDHLWKPLGFLILSVYWFHPLVWVSYHLFCKDVELACDEKATSKMGLDERADYCQTLLNVSADGRVSYACPLSFGEGDIKSRIKFVLNQKKTPLWCKVIFLLPCLCLGLLFMTSQKSQAVLVNENEQNHALTDGKETGGNWESSGEARGNAQVQEAKTLEIWEAIALDEESQKVREPYESTVSKEIVGMEEAASLLGDLPVYYAQDGEERAIRLTDFPALFHEEGDPYFKIWCFYVVDLEGDGVKEVIFQCYGVSAESGGRVILHQIGDKIYAYVAGWRTMWELYQDGSYFYSSWVPTNDGYARITEFTESGYVEDKYTYATGTYEGADSFVVDHEPVLEGDYLKATMIQRSKARINGCPFRKEYLKLITDAFQGK